MPSIPLEIVVATCVAALMVAPMANWGLKRRWRARQSNLTRLERPPIEAVERHPMRAALDRSRSPRQSLLRTLIDHR